MNTVELFVGCGGLLEGFEHSGLYTLLGGVEWEQSPVNELRTRLHDGYGMDDANNRILRFDIQRTDELINGWNDDCYGHSDGLDHIIAGSNIDVVVGGPPCQAYSVAGRIRDKNGMRDDYRNYLFESYMKIVSYYRPKAFIFENVPGILSAKPGTERLPIINRIKKTFEDAHYSVLEDLSNAIVDMTEYGVPQNRRRIIILGLNRDFYGERCSELLDKFYNVELPKLKENTLTVRDAIGDLPALTPLDEPIRWEGRKLSHSLPNPMINGHISRFHSKRDIDIFRMLEEDIESGRNQYVSTESLKELYTGLTGRKSNIHKYHVLRWDEPSNLIPAHLFKDGLRHIHPDSTQARTITVREAARLQTFPDEYIFHGSQTDCFKMIGNAVPPKFAEKAAIALNAVIGDIL